MMFICGKSKYDHLTRAITIPKKEDPTFKVWKLENNMIMSWLINYVTNEIGENFLLYGTAKEIWDATKETYSSYENTSKLFLLKVSFMNFDREIPLSPSTLISSGVSGNNLTYSKCTSGSVSKMKHCTNRSLKRNMCLNFLWE